MGYFTDKRDIHNVLWRLVVLLLLLDTGDTSQSLTPCPSSCHCSLLSDRAVAAVCRLGNHSDYAAVTRLPSNTTELICMVRGKLDQDALQLKSLWQLRKLVIRPEILVSYLNAKFTGTISELQRSSLLQNLSHLTSLGIHIPLLSLSPRILDPVPKLEILDMSYSYLHLRKALVRFLHSMSLKEHRLHTVNLTAVQRRHTTTVPEPILLREHIFTSLQKFPIKILDLVDNEIVEFQAGVSAYFTELEVVRLGSRRLLYVSDHERGCFNGEWLWQPTLRELFIRYPLVSYNAYHKAKRSLSENTSTHYHINSTSVKCAIHSILYPSNNSILCRFMNCICKGVIQIPCGRFPGVNIWELLDLRLHNGCHNHIRVPLPRQLERLTLQNANFMGISASNTIANVTIPDLPGNAIKLCLYEKNELKYFDISTEIIGQGRIRLSSDISLLGLRKMIFVNMQGNALFITAQMKLFSDMPLLRVLLLGGNMANLTHWEQLDFLHISSLESLDLKSCLLDNIPPLAFSSLESLRYLNLSDNGLETVDLILSRHLRMLDLSQNKVSGLSHEMTDYLDNIAAEHNVTLDLSQNPLRCFCDELRFVNLLKSTKVSFKNKRFTFCTHPTLSKVHPWDVDTEELHLICINFNAIISSISSALGVSALIGAVLVIYKRRWRIRFWIHTARESWRRKHSPERLGYERARDFIYDAFVAYSGNGAERRWVHTTLRENLEL